MLYLQKNKLVKNKVVYKNIIDKTVIPNHINLSTGNRLLGKNPSTDRQIYSTRDPYFDGVGKFIRNTSCWLNGISNISCFSPAQLGDSIWHTKAGTLITTKHIMYAAHFLIPIQSGGTPIIFVDENNNVVRRNLMGYRTHPDKNDIAIGVLDNDVPSNIKIAKVLPLNFRDYINTEIRNNLSNTFHFNPYLYLCVPDAEEKANIYILDMIWYFNTNAVFSGLDIKVHYFMSDPVIWGNNLPVMFPPLTNFTGFTETLIAGDSGNPNFLIIDNELVLLSTNLGYGGPFISTPSNYNEINSMINQLSPNQGYALTTINLNTVYHKYA